MSEDSFFSRLRPELAEKARAHRALCEHKGIPIAFLSGWRSPDEQRRLWLIGRSPGGQVLDASKIVTNALPEKAPHCRGAAYDAAPVVNEKVAWDRLDLFAIMGELGQQLGLVWGGSWQKLKDMPHYEIPEWRTLPLLT